MNFKRINNVIINTLIVAGLSLGLADYARAEGNNTIGISYALRDTIAGDNDRPNRQGFNVTYAHRFNQNWAVDTNQQFRTERFNTEDGNSSTRVEGGVTYTQKLSDTLAFYTRGGVGYRFTTNDDNTYYSVEPGLRFQTTDALNLRFAWRYRDSFNDRINDQTHTVRLGAEYALTKEDTLSAGIDRFYGDSELMGYNLGYTHRF